jgi:hypothetical protein
MLRGDMSNDFTLGCHWNEYLPPGGDRVDAILSIEAAQAGLAPGADRGLGGEVIMLDVSGSMAGPRFSQAALATAAALECLPNGVPFAVIAGNEQAQQVYPASGMVPALARTRAEARKALRRLRARGGTAIGNWISLATELFGAADGIRHAILLTDGRDEHETADSLTSALDAATGVFQCDCRGVGTDWRVSELRQVSTALLGSLDIVADPAGLTRDFRHMILRAVDRTVKDVYLRVWTPSGARIVLMKQVAPDIVAIPTTNLGSHDGTSCFSTGSWSSEARDYQLSVEVSPGIIGDRVLAARVEVVADGRIVAESLLSATWTDDEILTTRLNRQVAHYTGQQELADAIGIGLSARRAGDHETATAKLGLAVKLSAALCHTATAGLLERLVDVEDWESGTVRLRPHVALADEMALDTRSTRTVRRQP